jgi:hypothetical protein
MSTYPTPQPILRTAAAVERARRVGLVERFAARWAPWQLDQALSRGADPASSGALAARAAVLVRPATRRRLAASVRGAIDDAHRRDRVEASMVLVARTAVRGASPALRALAAALEAEELVAARGVARARLLLADGQGPLYRDLGADELARTANAARLALLT